MPNDTDHSTQQHHAVSRLQSGPAHHSDWAEIAKRISALDTEFDGIWAGARIISSGISREEAFEKWALERIARLEHTIDQIKDAINRGEQL